jgi:hypothetical protein
MWKWISKGEPPPPLTYTAGMLMTRDNVKEVLDTMGLDD